MGKTGDGAVTLSDESIPLMTFSNQQLIFRFLLPGFCLTPQLLTASGCQLIGNGFYPPAYLFLIDRTRFNTPATNQAVAAVNAMPGRAAATMA